MLIVGPGRVGRALALVHARAGDAVCLVGRTAGDWQAWAERFGIQTSVEIPLGADFATVLFAVPDDALDSVVAETILALAPRKGRLVVHCSGLHDLNPLAAFARAGAKLAAVHPVMAFASPISAAKALPDAFVTVLANKGSAAAALRLVEVWKARPVPLAADVDRRRVHFALSLAANHVTGLLAWAEELLRPAVGPMAHDLVHHLASQAVQQSQMDGVEVALTGPVVRGDVAAVQSHLQSLRGRERERALDALAVMLHATRKMARPSLAARRKLRQLLAP